MVVVTPTTYIRAFLVPNILRKGERQFSVIMKNHTTSYKTIMKGYQISIGIGTSEVLVDDVNQ